MKNLFTLLILSLILGACSSSSESVLEDSNWLNNTWLREYAGNTQIENWKKSDQTLQGNGAFANGVDTTEMVKYQITNLNGDWVLITQDVGFEDQLIYSIKSSNSDSCVFVNSGGEWPQLIKYKKLGANQMEKTISGQNGSMKKEISLTFNRK